MADNFLNKTGLQYYHNRIKSLFATATDLTELETKVDAIEVPTKTSELTNDSDYQTGADVTDAVADGIADSIADESTNSIASKSYVAANGGKIDTIKVNGTAQPIDAQKAVDITVPTKTSDITNDSTYQTLTEVADLIDAAIADVTQFDYEIVQTLPATGVKGTIYLVEDTTNPGTYKEYIWVNNAWEQIGQTGTVDLTGYWAKEELVAITTAEIDAIIAA